MPAKTTKKRSSKVSKSIKKSTSMSMIKTRVAHQHDSEPFYADPKNLMVIGAVMLLFIVLVFLLSGSTGIRY